MHRFKGIDALVLFAALISALASSPSALAQAGVSQAPTGAAPAGVVPPKIISDVTVEYPPGAKGDARVVVTLVIGADGRVQSATALEQNEPFSSQAVTAAANWRFEPATRNGKPVAAKILFEVVFKEPVPEPVPETPEAAAAPSAPATEQAPPRPRPPPAPGEVVVHGMRPEPSRTVSLSRAEVREIPGTFGDPFRALEIMPGVTPIVTGLPFFFVRGAPPGNVGYFLDSIRVPVLFHVGIGPSVIHPGLVDRVDLYPGGYPARYGRFAGGIVAAETVQPQNELHGEYNVRLFDAGALVETPFADGRGTALAAGRYSYTGYLLTLLASDVVLDYWDYQLRATYDVTPEDRVGVFAFGSYDFLGQKTQGQPLPLFSTEFHRVDLRYDHELPHGRIRTAVTTGLDRTRVTQADRSVVSHMYATRTEIEQRLSRNALLRTGGDLELDQYGLDLGQSDLSSSAAAIASLFATRTDIALGTRADVVLGIDGLEVTPGVRFDLFGSEGASEAAVDPRLSTRAALSKRIDVLGNFGIAHQPPAFVIPLPGAQPGGLRGGLQRSIQESLGLEFDLGDSTTLTTTVFQNAFFNMTDPLGVRLPQVNGCPPGAYPTDTIGGDRETQPNNPTSCIPRFPPGTLGPDRSGGGGQGANSTASRNIEATFAVRTMGQAYGLELFLKRKLTKRIGGFLSYTLSRSTRTYGNQSFVAFFDRTHVVNAAVAYDLGRNWRAGTRVTFYTGLPKAPDPTDPDSTRLPPFFRVDLRLEKRWQITKKVWIAFVAEVMNATLSKEAITTRCDLRGCETQTIGPVTIPSIGVEGGF